MGKDVEKSNLFETSHIMILIAYSILSVTLIAESFLMQWEKWALILIAVGVLLSWWLHIRQYLSDSNRLWVYSLLMMATFFSVMSVIRSHAAMLCTILSTFGKSRNEIYDHSGNQSDDHLCQQKL